MQANLEQVTTLIRALPLEDLGKLREVIDEEQAKFLLSSPQTLSHRDGEFLLRFTIQ